MSELLIKNILAEEIFGNRICESLSQYDTVNTVYKELMLEKLLFGEPISIPELRKILRKKVINFEFIKLDGEVRPARGTTMMKYIPDKDHPKGVRPSSEKVATFFDMDKQAWRSVSNRSKEIVLQRDEETQRPKVVVSDKTDVKDKKPTKHSEAKPMYNTKPSFRPTSSQAKPKTRPDIPIKPETKPIDTDNEEETLDITDTTKLANDVKDNDIVTNKTQTEPEVITPEIEKTGNEIDQIEKKDDNDQSIVDQDTEPDDIDKEEDIVKKEDDNL